MSYMDNSAFDNGIQELSLDEIDNVNGAIASLVAAGLVVGGIILVSFAAEVIAGYLAND